MLAASVMASSLPSTARLFPKFSTTSRRPLGFTFAIAFRLPRLICSKRLSAMPDATPAAIAWLSLAPFSLALVTVSEKAPAPAPMPTRIGFPPSKTPCAMLSTPLRPALYTREAALPRPSLPVASCTASSKSPLTWPRISCVARDNACHLVLVSSGRYSSPSFPLKYCTP